MFKNRTQAAEQLVKKLQDYKKKENVIVVTIPRGGMPMGYTIATQLHLPLDIVLSKKIGHPYNKEFAIGAVTLKDVIIRDKSFDVSEEYIHHEAENIRELLKQRQDWYYGTSKPLNLKDKTVIIVDDGVATGNTLISCIKLINKQKPTEIIVALPVGPPSVLKTISAMPSVTKTISLLTPNDFRAVGQYYKDFSPVNDIEAIDLLKKANDKFKQIIK